jgi:hypothetical protein
LGDHEIYRRHVPDVTAIWSGQIRRILLVFLIPNQEITMTLCPIAIVASCSKCPIVKVCPLKSTLGDTPRKPETKPATVHKKNK